MAMPGGVDMGAILSDQLMKAASVVEDQIDAEMAKMQKLPDEDELEVRIWNIGSVLVWDLTTKDLSKFRLVLLSLS